MKIKIKSRCKLPPKTRFMHTPDGDRKVLLNHKKNELKKIKEKNSAVNDSDVATDLAVEEFIKRL